MIWLRDWASGIQAMTVELVVLLGFLYLLEGFSLRGRASPASQLRSLKFWAVQIAIGALILLGARALVNRLPIQPLLVIPLDDWLAHSPLAWASLLIGPCVGFLLYDFFQYWMHRAQHRFLWEQHAIHHSIEELSAVNSYFHWSEEILRAMFIYVPMAILFRIETAPAILLVTMLNCMHGYYLHSPTGINFGRRMRHVLADNKWHRIHHSREPEHFDRNFGAFTTLWDRLFGTAYFPAADEWPATGVADRPEPRTIADYAWRPFVGLRPRDARSGEHPTDTPPSAAEPCRRQEIGFR